LVLLLLVASAALHMAMVAIFDIQADALMFDFSALAAYAALILSCALALPKLLPADAIHDALVWGRGLKGLQAIAWPLSVALLLVSGDMLASLFRGHDQLIPAEMTMCRTTSNVPGRPSIESPMYKGRYCVRLASGSVLHAYPSVSPGKRGLELVPGERPRVQGVVADSWLFGANTYFRHVRLS